MKKFKRSPGCKGQGVGFRMYPQQQARQLGVSGYVRNLRNRDMEMVAAGEAAKVDAFLK